MISGGTDKIRFEIGYSGLFTTAGLESKPGLGSYVKEYGAMARDSFQNGLGVSATFIQNTSKLSSGLLLRYQMGRVQPEDIYSSDDATGSLFIASPFIMSELYKISELQILGGLSIDGYLPTGDIQQGSIGINNKKVLGLTPFVKVLYGEFSLTAGIPLTNAVDIFNLNRVDTSFAGEEGTGASVTLAGQESEQAIMLMLNWGGEK